MIYSYRHPISIAKKAKPKSKADMVTIKIVKRKKVQDLEAKVTNDLSHFVGEPLNSVTKAALLESLGLSLESYKQDLMDEQTMSEVPQEAIVCKVQPMSPPQDLVYYVPAVKPVVLDLIKKPMPVMMAADIVSMTAATYRYLGVDDRSC